VPASSAMPISQRVVQVCLFLVAAIATGLINLGAAVTIRRQGTLVYLLALGAGRGEPALLPEDSCVDDVRRGALVHLCLNGARRRASSTWSSRRPGACCPAVRAFVDHFAQAFSVMRGRGRMLVPDQNEKVGMRAAGDEVGT